MSLLTSLIDPISTLLDKVIMDKDEKARLAHEIATLATRQAHEIAMAQIEVNKEEAKHSKLFVSGWRPFIGWTCGVALCWHFLLAEMVTFALVWGGLEVPTMPDFDMGSLMTLLFGLLGLGGLRTYEKTKGVTR